jgi:hypothetical protein
VNLLQNFSHPNVFFCLGFISDEENDNEPIPFFLLPDDSTQKIKKSPLMNRSSTPPQIQLVSLKNFSGLENVRAGQLSGQDSLDAGSSHKAPPAAARQQLPLLPPPERQLSVSAGAGETLAAAAGAREPPAALSEKAGRSGGGGPTISNLEENKVKIQVPGLPAATRSSHGGGKTDE